MNYAMTHSNHQRDIAQAERFEFGKNWAQFLKIVDGRRITEAKQSLGRMLKLETLVGKSFLDVGSGSGLFSLAAMRLGAERVHSFDYDPQSVSCTKELRRRYYSDTANWTIEQGSALDTDYLASLGTFNIVYSWGVLHHTGDMWTALGNMVPLVVSGGLLYIAIYNDQGGWSRRWTAIKRIYNRLPRLFRTAFGLMILGPRELRMAAIATARLRPISYVRSWTHYSQQSTRGMSRWHDMVDWLGGYPFEVAKPEEIFRFYRDRGFTLEELVTQRASIGCNEFVFRRD
jgi:2-polyprenyl-3-methyl-5-hydroxy-6-metoxy-1,4-benzoquinol methylase